MNKTLEIQELAIVIAVKNHNPAILNLDFLKYSGIVPAEWEVARPPISTNQASQVTFQDGVSILVESNKITFLEAIAAKDFKEVKIPAIARKYVETLSHVDYQALGINFRGHVLFDKEGQTARNYIFETLLSPGSWQEVGKAPVQAAMRFVYSLEQAKLTLDINEVGLQLPEKEVLPAVLFSANFTHAIAGDSQSERLHALSQVIGEWQLDLETYREIINTRFLKSENYQLDVAPGELLMSITPTA